MSSRRVPVLVSPDAGRGEARSGAAAVFPALRNAGVEPVDITGIDATASLAAAHRAVESGAERLLVIGGDGLVNMGLQAVAGTPTVLGIIPVGTGNDFVRGLTGFDTDAVAAIPQALGPATELDAISTDRGWVASVATVGFSADVNSRANALRWPRGPSRYSVATMLQLPRLKRHDLSITIDGRLHEMKAVLVAVANTAWFGGGMEICPGADPTDSMLDVTIVGDVGRLGLLRFFRRVFRGTHLDHPDVHTFRGREIAIDGADLCLWGDGEPLGPTPVTLTAVSSALRLAR